METNAAPSIHTTKPRSVTYLGVPATAYTIARDKDDARFGERVSVIEWHGEAIGQPVVWPAGTVTVHHIEGDGRSPDFVQHDQMRAVEDASAYAQSVL